jgi:hypothetical protein
MTIVAIIGFCVLLFVLALLVPRLSRKAHRGGDSVLAVGQRTGGKAPGPIGRLFSKSFGSSRRAAGKSRSAGERTRDKLPL